MRRDRVKVSSPQPNHPRMILLAPKLRRERIGMRSKMGWPAAHRNVGAIGRQGGLSIPGSQRMPKPYSPRSIPGRPPSGPGNDNFPWRPPPPNGHQFGKKGRGVDKELRKFVRKSPAVRRMIKWNPVFRWVWQWYNYLNPEPVANQRPDNTGWVLTWKCKDGYGENLRQYPGNTCPVYSPSLS